MEMRDVFTREGAYTGKVIEKGTKIGAQEYLYHVHIIMKHVNGQYLLQQRSLKARYFPGQWDVTGGGVRHGETGAEAAAREAREELGVEIDPSDCALAGRQLQDGGERSSGLITDVFGARIDICPQDLVLSAREVAGAKFVSFREFVDTVLYNKDEHYRRILEKVEEML